MCTELFLIPVSLITVILKSRTLVDREPRLQDADPWSGEGPRRATGRECTWSGGQNVALLWKPPSPGR